MDIPNSTVPTFHSRRCAPLVECFLESKATLATRRLSNLTAYGKHHFQLYASSNPFPLFPKTVTVTRNYVKSSTKNNTKSGSIYNNWSLPTMFQQEDRRRILRVPDVLKKLTISQSEFSSICQTYFQKYRLSGVPTDLSTWSGGENDTIDPTFTNQLRQNIRGLQGLLKAAGKSSTYCVIRGIGIVSIHENIEVASIEDIKLSLDKIFIAMNMSSKVSQGITVPAIGRALLFWIWSLAMICTVSFLAYTSKAGLQLWTVDFFEAILFSIISVPALVEYISEESAVIRNAISGKRTLWKNSQVMSYFDFDEFDCAVMALINDPIWIISDEKASFTQQGGHTGLTGDVFITDTDSLRKLGAYVGRSMARKKWEDENRQITHRSDGSIFISRTPSVAGWISGEGSNVSVC